MTNKKILLVGNWRWDIYEEALASGFRANGLTVIPFKLSIKSSFYWFYLLQKKIKLGPAVYKLNKDILYVAEKESPDIIFLNRTDIILPKTLKKLKNQNSNVLLVTFHNDNPFVGLKNRVKWRHYLRSLSLADITFVYRPSNINDAKRFGASNIHVIPPYYLSYRHCPMFDSTQSYSSDVIYIGHYENDGRAESIDYLIKNGISVELYGTGWDTIINKYSNLAGKNVRSARGDEYTLLLSGSKIALVFLSKMNRDVWTRRCFEIPACGTLMIAPRTRELEGLFEDGSEAVYYNSREDLLERIKHFLVHDKERENIAKAGLIRCIAGAHSEIGRTKKIIELIEDFRNNTGDVNEDKTCDCY